MLQKEISKSILNLVSELDMVNNIIHCSDGWKMEQINNIIQVLSAQVSIVGKYDYILPEEDAWLEEDALGILVMGPRQNPALHQSALYWSRKYGSKELRVIIENTYRYAGEINISFDTAFNEVLSDHNAKESLSIKKRPTQKPMIVSKRKLTKEELKKFNREEMVGAETSAKEL